jgi:hypothetical protein
MHTSSADQMAVPGSYLDGGLNKSDRLADVAAALDCNSSSLSDSRIQNEDRLWPVSKS